MEGVDGFSLRSTPFVLSDALAHLSIYRVFLLLEQWDLLPLGTLLIYIFLKTPA